MKTNANGETLDGASAAFRRWWAKKEWTRAYWSTLVRLWGWKLLAGFVLLCIAGLAGGLLYALWTAALVPLYHLVCTNVEARINTLIGVGVLGAIGGGLIWLCSGADRLKERREELKSLLQEKKARG